MTSRYCNNVVFSWICEVYPIFFVQVPDEDAEFLPLNEDLEILDEEDEDISDNDQNLDKDGGSKLEGIVITVPVSNFPGSDDVVQENNNRKSRRFHKVYSTNTIRCISKLHDFVDIFYKYALLQI